MMFGKIKYIAFMLDDQKLHDFDDSFNDGFAYEYRNAKEHLGNIVFDKSSAIYKSLMHKKKIEYVCDLFKHFVPVNEKFLALATEISFVGHKAYCEWVAITGDDSDEGYYSTYGYCELENQYEAEWREFVELCRFDAFMPDDDGPYYVQVEADCWLENKYEADEIQFMHDKGHAPIGRIFEGTTRAILDYVLPMLEHVESTFWGPVPKFMWEDCQPPKAMFKYICEFDGEDLDRKAIQLIESEFAHFLFDQFGSLDALKAHLEGV